MSDKQHTSAMIFAKPSNVVARKRSDREHLATLRIDHCELTSKGIGNDELPCASKSHLSTRREREVNHVLDRQATDSRLRRLT